MDLVLFSLIALASTSNSFKSLNIAHLLHINRTNTSILETKSKNLYYLEKLFNERSIRHLSNQLIEILIDKDLNQDDLLKQYLRKYKYVYKRFFFLQKTSLTQLPTDKELNKFAVEALLLLIGV